MEHEKFLDEFSKKYIIIEKASLKIMEQNLHKNINESINNKINDLKKELMEELKNNKVLSNGDLEIENS